MKVLVIQENGRHEKNKLFRECFCLQRSLNKIGVHTDVWGLGHANYEVRPDFDTYDLIINLENYDTTGWVPDLANTQKPKKFLWSIDAHCRGIDVFRQTYDSGKYSLILQATKDFVDENSVWFPNCYDHTIIKPTIKKEHFLGFCGSLLNREPILNFLEKEHGLKKDIFKIGSDMVDTVSSYYVHFNINLANDINYRSFETLGCNTMLLTNYNYQYEELGFIDGKNCMMYKNVKELSEKLNICREDKPRILEIAAAGYELAKKHTYDERAKKIISLFEDMS